eukprot:Gb_13687 [translate_table: standard]
MVNLFLSFPKSEISSDDTQRKNRVSLLDRLEPVIWRIITADGRSEARLWLCNAIASIKGIPNHKQSALFSDLLHSSNAEKKEGRRGLHVATQVLRMVCQTTPDKVGKIIAKKSRLLQRFFKGHSRRILEWFNHFAGIGEYEHKRGARAISQFAFVNRDLCWDELEWKGRHGQSPAMVATKPHYFLDLDVIKTVENLLENVPDFWSSEEFAISLQNGEILSVDMEFFVEELLHMMYDDNSSEMWQAVYDFLSEEKFSSLCQRLLIFLSDWELLAFLNKVGKVLASENHDSGFQSQGQADAKAKASHFNLLEIVTSLGIECQCLDELLLSNACINCGRQILRLLRDEDHGDEKQKLDEIVAEMKQNSNVVEHWALRRECLRVNKWVAIKWLALESWVLQYCLSLECNTSASCESLFILNGIEFRHSNISFVDCDELSSKERSLEFFGKSKRSRKMIKDKARKKKRRRKSLKDYRSSSGDEHMDNEYSEKLKSSEMKDRNWLLSTDNFTSTWNIVDLPEHLAGYSFLSWLKWVSSSRNS